MLNQTSTLTIALLPIGQGVVAQSPYGPCTGSSGGAFSVGSEVEVVYDISLRPLRRTRRGRVEAGEVCEGFEGERTLKVVARRVANL